jgi:hypothetical protein
MRSTLHFLSLSREFENRALIACVVRRLIPPLLTLLTVTGREGSFSVRAWLDQTYDNENELLKEDPQISFSHDAVSTVEDEDEDEDDTLPGSGPYPSSVSVPPSEYRS